MIRINTTPNSNDLLRYASYIVINKYKEKKGKPPSGLYFNKIMSLCHRNLLEKDIDIGLPHYWYRYGDQVHKRGMPTNLVWQHESPLKTTVEWRYEEPDFFRHDAYDIIEEIVIDLTNKYSDKRKQLVQKVYEYAPFDFQRGILDLRGVVYGWKNALNWDSKNYKLISKGVILDSLSHFPDKEFPELKQQYRLFKKVVEILLEKEDWGFKIFEEAYINFWFWFCYHLRLKKGASENIPKKTIAYWESKLDFENVRYKKIMGDLIIQASKKYPKIIKDKQLAKEYRWRTKDLKETYKLIDEFEFSKDFEEYCS